MLIALSILALSVAASNVSTLSVTVAGTRALRAAAQRQQAELVRDLDLWSDHSRWENAWRVRTGDYEVRCVDSFFAARRAGRWLDTMRGHFRELLGGPERAPAAVEVQILPGLQDYRAFGDAHGAEHSSFLGSFYATQAPGTPIATYSVENSTLLGMWLTHSAFHEYVQRSLRGQPSVAVSEGLASYFALRYWAWSYSVGEFENLKANGRYIPLSRLLAEGLSSYANDTHARTTELGMLFSYLLHFREDTRIQVDELGAFTGPAVEYLRRAVRGQDVRNLMLHDLLTEDLELLEADFQAFEFPE